MRNSGKTRAGQGTAAPKSAAGRGRGARGGSDDERGPARRTRRAAAAPESDPNLTPDRKWRLRLYVAGQTPKSLTAFGNLKRLCEQYLPGKYQIEVIDLLENPQLAQGDQIVAVPTLVRRLPQPLKRVIGDLSNTERALIGLDLRPGS